MLSIITIYERPKDYPDSYVARRFYGTFPTSDYHISPEIGPLREWAKKMVLKWNQSEAYNLGRSPGDQPQIVESWV